jgi:hypothetical protein
LGLFGVWGGLLALPTAGANKQVTVGAKPVGEVHEVGKK